MRNAALRRELRKLLGTRTSRRASTKVKDGSRTHGAAGASSATRKRRPRAKAVLNEILNGRE